MKTFQVEVNIPVDRRLVIDLPEDFEMGSYQIVVVMNPIEDSGAGLQQGHRLNDLAGCIRSFAGIDGVAWQQQIREEWDGN